MKLHNIRIIFATLISCAISFLISLSGASAETLDTLNVYGNATQDKPGAPPNDVNAAGNPRGADFSGSATGSYIITSGGTDIWGNSDHGTFIHDADGSRAAGTNFSAVVRSVSIAADPLEPLGNNWGRTGLMARQDAGAANSPNVAHIRRDGNNAWTSLQGRKNAGQGTDRDGGEMGNGGQAAGNPFDRTRAFWLGLHRVDGFWYATWAEDNAGSPGTWSAARKRNDSGNNMNGEVWVGLAHQSHGGNNAHNLGGNTAVFDNFRVSDFGTFTSGGGASLTLDGTNVVLSSDAFKLGTDPAASSWRVDHISGVPTLTYAPGLKADIYMVGNKGNQGAFDAMVANDTPNGTAYIETPYWWSNNYTSTNAAGTNLFAEAVPGSFGGGQDNYNINMTGQIHIPSDADRGGNETVQFHDGIDDFTLLVIDGVKVIEHNGWSNQDGHNGTLGSFDCSDPKFDDGEWVDIQFGMGEGGGGDNCSLAWNALSVSGADSVTGGTSATGAWNPNNIAINGNGNVPHGGYRVPTANYRTSTPNYVEATQSGAGVATDLTLDNPVSAATTVAVKLYVDGALVTTLNLNPTLSSISLTDYSEITLVIGDGEIGFLNEATMAASLDGTALTVDSAIRDGDQTTIVLSGFTAKPLSDISVDITAVTTLGTAVSLSGTVLTYPLYEVIRDGLPEPPNSTVGWDYYEWTGVGNANGGRFWNGQEAIRNNAPAANAIEPFINHSDPDSNNGSGPGGGAGYWGGDRPQLTGQSRVDDNDVTTYARTIWTATAGDYTVLVKGDDGYALRVTGASVTGVGGHGQAKVGADGSTAYNHNNNGNAGGGNNYVHINIAEDGDYLVEFFGWEGGGGNHQEISLCPGTRTGNRTQTTGGVNNHGWKLFGNMAEFVPTSRWGEIPTSLLPPLPKLGDAEQGWATSIWYSARNGSNQEVNNLDQTMRFITDVAEGYNSNRPRLATWQSQYLGVLSSLNHSQNGENKGRINPTLTLPAPNSPGSNGVIGAIRNDRIVMLAHAALNIPVAGDYTIQMRSDDGFLIRFLDPANTFHNERGGGMVELGYPSEISHENGTGDSNTRATATLTAGVHHIAVVWFEGGGGTHFEVSYAPGKHNNQNGPFVLLDNTVTTPVDTDGDGLGDGWELANFTDLSKDGTADSDGDGRTDLQEYGDNSDPTSDDSDGDGVLDGAENTAGTNPANADSDGDGFQDGWEAANGSDGTDDTDPISSADPILLAHWDFNDPSVASVSMDTAGIAGIEGCLTRGAVYTADAGGSSGAAGDYGLDLGGAGSQSMIIDDLAIVNAAAAQNEIAISFWQKINQVANESSFWFWSQSTNGNRAMQAHSPWGNSQLYWDTAGCCNGNGERLNGNVGFNKNQWQDHGGDNAGWHHFVYSKKGNRKEVWVDGELKLAKDNTEVLPTDISRAFIGGGNNGGNSLRGSMDNFAIFSRALSSSQIGYLALGVPAAIITSGDGDGDGMLDAWEYAYFGNLDKDGTADSDSDGLTDAQESALSMNPTSSDGDGDGLLDGAEVAAGSDPNHPDSDGDGISDGTDADPMDAAIPSPAETLLAYWPLDTTDGVTTPDLGPDGYDMTLTNMSAANFVSDAGRTVASFDGTQLLSYTAAPGDNIPANLHPGFTVSMWVKIKGTGQNDKRFFSEGATTNNNPLFNLGTKNNGVDDSIDLYIRDNGSPNHQFSTGRPLDDTWRHIALTSNDYNRTIRLYVDGVLDRENWPFWDVQRFLNTTSIGGILRGSSCCLVTGLVDDVALWKKALTAGDIADLAAGIAPNALGAPLTPLVITNVVYNEDGTVTLTWNSRPGKTYAVRFTDSFNDDANGNDPRLWPDLDDAWPSGGETTSFTDIAPPAKRFYVIEEQ